eukprot:Protomagalhaensia_sp_Gyna_25__3159@NODE_288_length_4041_cov_58_999250_g222_i0_p2_GENE_NODE_288_length_4041_cov_58_999250_g222_i0NODE_288_length_4041_cov_58_999250_g222_i0_p2_ORF_typecomplete_len289_score29_69Ubox/PF04564_15/5_3e10zfCCHC_2/PF13696_6/4_5e08zfC3HC4_2/PF13923_6/1_2e06zfRING_6/PF14835_6/6_4e05zfC3HC4_3/PF13920_6/1_5e03zfC3HC4_3/PF13920_6/3e05zfC3HC4/PF00097_25/8_5e05Baculo_IE1/PF05290_11/0_00048zfRING_2/PF13639_6/0_0032zfnanos/PF05741_13/0_22zfnanos/PF05741_13/8_4e03zfnanos/PF05741_1
MTSDQPSLKRKAEEDSKPPKRHKPDKEDEEDAILRVISQHAEHRGPREAGASNKPADTLARRYMRGRNLKESSSATSPPHLQIPLNSQYICHMCGEKGHHIKLCPKRQGRRQSKKIRTATGIPRSWLRPIAPEDIGQHDDVYCLSNGQLAVLKTPAENAVSEIRAVSRDPQLPLVDEGLLEDLKCPLCHEVFQNAHLVSCCGMTYCGSCIFSYVERHSTCPKCNAALNKGDIAPNDTVQESLDSFCVVPGLSRGKLTQGPSSSRHALDRKEHLLESAADTVGHLKRDL